MENNIAKYLTQQVMTASPAKLVYMLYDRAIASLREAISAIEKGEIEARWKANKQATDIIEHLWSTLDTDQGGEISENLDKLFPTMLMRLPDVDIRNDPQPAKDVIRLLEPLRDAWREIAMNGTGTPGSSGTATYSDGGASSSPTERTSISA